MFQPEPTLTQLVAGNNRRPMSSVAQIGFHYNNPQEIVVGAESGIFYRDSTGNWKDFTYVLPQPLAIITGVGIDAEALYVSFDSRSIARITGYR